MTIRQQVVDFVTAFIRQSSGAADVDPSENIFSAGLLDSVGIMKLIAGLETEFGVRVPPGDLLPENFQSAEAMADYLSRLSGA